MTNQAERLTRRYVRRGARLLDRHRPGWWRRVRTTRLRMDLGFLDRNGCGCVLAQVYGSYSDGLNTLEPHLRERPDDADCPPEEHGFNAHYEAILANKDADISTFDLLDEAWTAEVTARRQRARA